MHLENFIPVSIEKLCKDLLKNNLGNQAIFNKIIDKYRVIANNEFNQIKENYQLFNPDLDLIIDENKDKQLAKNELLKKTKKLLKNANYTKLSTKELQKAISNNSHLGLNIEVDIDNYEFFDIYYRGKTNKDLIIEKWWNSFKKPKTVNIDIYTRLFIVAKLKNFQEKVNEISTKNNITLKKAEKILHKRYKSLPSEITDEFIFFKSFKDIPSSDLETLFFMRQIRLKLFDKIKFILTGGVSTTTGVMATIGKLAVAVSPVAILVAIGGFIGIIAKQIIGVFNQHNKYNNTLTTNLYFKSLNNNLGAINFISNNASEEEIKETILAFAFQEKNPNVGDKELDNLIEKYLQDTYKITIDFEIDDALNKIKDLKL
jgi:hypothetical protein